MSTVYVHPDVPKWWGRNIVHHEQQQVAWIWVQIVGISYSYAKVDARVDVVQQFIDAMGWKGKALNNYNGEMTANVVRKSNGTVLRLNKGANGLLEYSGGYVLILWDWDQVFTWLKDGWPTTKISGVSNSSPVGTWCFVDGADPYADHIRRDKHTGWEHAAKQMRTVGIPGEVRNLQRPLNEVELIDGLCAALKHHRVSLDQLHA